MGKDTAAQWTAIVLAGQRPGTDSLAAHFGMEHKALVPLAGKAMLTHVLETLHGAPEIGPITVIAREEPPLAEAMRDGGGADFFASARGISASILSCLDSMEAPYPLLVTTADHPLLTPAMIAEFCAGSGGDLAVGMVQRSAMLARFPDAQRTWINMRDDGWSGANLFALRSDRAKAALELWQRAEQDRKQVAKLFWHFGPWLAIRALLRQVRMADALQLAGRRIGVDARLVALADPVAAIDVDKPSDHALATLIRNARD